MENCFGRGKIPEFRTFTEKIQQMEPKEWIRLDVNDIRTELHKIHINKKDGDTKETSVFYAPTPHTRRAPPPPPQNNTQQNNYTPPRPRTPTPQRYTITEKLQHFQCPPGVCLGYYQHGVRPRQNKGRPCTFSHTQTVGGVSGIGGVRQSVSPSRSVSPNRSRSMSPVGQPFHTPQTQNTQQCPKCGNIHRGVCWWNKRCLVCKGLHAAKVCPHANREKKQYRIGGRGLF